MSRKGGSRTRELPIREPASELAAEPRRRCAALLPNIPCLSLPAYPFAERSPLADCLLGHEVGRGYSALGALDGRTCGGFGKGSDDLGIRTSKDVTGVPLRGGCYTVPRWLAASAAGRETLLMGRARLSSSKRSECRRGARTRIPSQARCPLQWLTLADRTRPCLVRHSWSRSSDPDRTAVAQPSAPRQRGPALPVPTMWRPDAGPCVAQAGRPVCWAA